MPTWNVEEIPNYVITVDDREIFGKLSQRGEPATEIVNEDKRKDRKSNDFHVGALDKMMDGVLELR